MLDACNVAKRWERGWQKERTESGVLGHLELLDERYSLVFAGFAEENAFQVTRHELGYDHQLTRDRAGPHEKHNCRERRSSCMMSSVPNRKKKAAHLRDVVTND
jgi:hypothetical protein